MFFPNVLYSLSTEMFSSLILTIIVCIENCWLEDRLEVNDLGLC